MNNYEEIQKAVNIIRTWHNSNGKEFLNKQISDALVVLDRLAGQYLSIKEYLEEKVNAIKEYESIANKNLGFNEALHLCKLAILSGKNKVS